MAVPTAFSDLSTTAATNAALIAGSDSPTVIDDHLRTIYAMLASIAANSGYTWTTPYLAKASPVLIGTSSVGTMAATAVLRLGDLGLLSKTSTGVANGGTVDIALETVGAGYQGVLVLAITKPADANVRTQAVYAIVGRGTTMTATSLSSTNGSGGAATFTLTAPSNGLIRLTNTSGVTCDIYMQFIGGVSY